jgi:hypothetical protein
MAPYSTCTRKTLERLKEVWERNSWLRYYCFRAATILMLCILGQETQKIYKVRRRSPWRLLEDCVADKAGIVCKWLVTLVDCRDVQTTLVL